MGGADAFDDLGPCFEAFRAAVQEVDEGIDITAIKLASQINGALAAARKAGCCCYYVHVLAHSQGAMVTKMALELVSKEGRDHMTVVTIGGEIFLPNDTVRFVDNIAHVNDPVPNKWGAPLNEGGWNIVRHFYQKRGTARYFGQKGVAPNKGYDAHKFEVYLKELQASPPKNMPNCIGEKPKNK